jgi:hypothetical protein
MRSNFRRESFCISLIEFSKDVKNYTNGSDKLYNPHQLVTIVARIILLHLVALQPLRLDQCLFSWRAIEEFSDRRSVEADGAVSQYL